jgi:DNA-binding ferritin-like protein
MKKVRTLQEMLDKVAGVKTEVITETQDIKAIKKEKQEKTFQKMINEAIAATSKKKI